MAWSDRPSALKVLGWATFFEAIIFPVPPDPLLMAIIFNRPRRWLRLALLTSAASIAGGVVGYLFGVGLFETVGRWIIETNHLQSGFAQLGDKFDRNAFLGVLTAALTPIPFKIITIAAGAFSVNFVTFILAATLGRVVRFTGVGYLAAKLGKDYREAIERYINLISVVIVLILAVVIYWLR